MKVLSFFALTICLFAFSTCEVDADFTPACTQADFVDVFEGTEDCGGDPENVTFAFTAEGSSAVRLRIRFEDGSTLTTTDPVQLDRCKFTFGDDELTVNGTLDGDMLTVSATRSDGTCTYRLTRA